MIQQQIAFFAKQQVKLLFWSAENNPETLAFCLDSLGILFYRGNLDLSGKRKIISAAVTRSYRSYGEEFSKMITQNLASYDSKSYILVLHMLLILRLTKQLYPTA